MKYTEKDLYKGMKLRCTDGGRYDFWTKGGIYEVEESEYVGLVIKGDGVRSDRPTGDILRYLNGEALVKMEIVEEELKMLVTKKKHDLLIKNYNELVDDRDTWKEAYNKSQSNNIKLEQWINRLEKELDKADDEVFDLELERDTYKEKYEECWQKFIKTLGELNRTDEVILEYEKRINELEEK